MRYPIGRIPHFVQGGTDVHTPLDLRLDRKTQTQLLILNLIRKSGGISRIDLAAKLGLTKSAMTLLTNGMIDEGLLNEKEEVPQGQQKRGRRKVLLQIEPSCRLAFGAVIGKGSLSVGLTDLSGASLERRSISTEGMTYRDVLGMITELTKAMLKENYIPQKRVLGIGVALEDRAADLIEGATGSEKLLRLKRDLSYGLQLPIVTVRAAAGALLAQRLFFSENVQNALLLHVDGRTAEAALLTDGHIYSGSQNLLSFACRDVDPLKLAADYIRLFRPEKIFLSGVGFSAETAQPISGVPTQYTDLEGRNRHLCGCAAAVERLFYLDSSF